MDMCYSGETDIIHFFFTIDEVINAHSFLEIATERQIEKGNDVPVLPSLEDVLEVKRLSEINEQICLEFDKENKELGVEFITVMIEFYKEEGISTSPLVNFLDTINSTYFFHEKIVH